jgi:SOS-response transcriptional repressor LexA
MTKSNEDYIPLLKAIEQYREEHGFAPAVRNLMTMLDVSSTSVVIYQLRGAEEKGFLLRDFYISRSTRLTDAGRELLAKEG